MSFERGDIVLVPQFKFPNGNPGSRHLFIIIDEDTAVDIQFLTMIVSSKQSKARENSDNPAHEFNATVSDPVSITKLNKPSHVKADQVFKFSEEHLLSVGARKTGEISEDYMEELLELFAEVIEQSRLKVAVNE